MRRLSSHNIGIAQGQLTLFSDFEDGGEMWTGRGQRERGQHVFFDEAFMDAPSVHVSIALWDMDTTTVLRADVDCENVTREGFDAIFRTWGDTRVARVRVAWMAIGALANDDDWDVG